MSRMMQLAVLILVTSLLGACAPIQPEREVVQRDDLRVDPEIGGFVTVTELLEKRIDMPGGGDLLKIQFAVQAYQDTLMEWAVTWFDAEGMVVPGVGEGYRPARVLPNQTRFFTATAPHEKVVSYQLHLREDREP
ncbi:MULTISPECIES: YcfL family protein [Marinobacter]|uniref:YcfL family protein n=1 Tax=Marinobacter metalliresistant TaxID=2961995 RepID=A0ABZ2W2Z1_9GAMM|nr:YcfL family protein [Marinobacter sp. Arc7-DN-1]AXS81847.1 hypothetical protein D0851_01530 [Marinobacter sp. Arc7-DN-1]